MQLHRIQAKVFLRNPEALKLQDLIPVFHRWIQQKSLDEMLIDVANYAHVHEGPGILLIAHEADYALDLGRGLPGLLYTRKRDVPADLTDAVGLALRQVLHASERLEQETALRFGRDEVEITFPDRLQIPNTRDSLDLVRVSVEAALETFFPADDVSLEWMGDDGRLPFSVRSAIEGGVA